ncbi:unnamed protein product [Malus baccata var. baccata]
MKKIGSKRRLQDEGFSQSGKRRITALECSKTPEEKRGSWKKRDKICDWKIERFRTSPVFCVQKRFRTRPIFPESCRPDRVSKNCR